MIIAKEIQLDMGHRVPNHHSKCRNLHGHRYKIVAFVEGPVIRDGSQEGMVLDFGFLKDVLMEVVHAKYDHTLILSLEDPITATLVPKWFEIAPEYVAWSGETLAGILHAVAFVPTAENLAIYWAAELKFPVKNCSGGAVKLIRLQVWETPTSMAEYTLLPEATIEDIDCRPQ